jgi:hypothetical protein
MGEIVTESSSEAACRICSSPLHHSFVDLGSSPLCESFLAAEQLNGMEPFYPLGVYVCEQCFLVQLQEYVEPDEIFSEYAYFSSYSDSWLRHAKDYVEMASERFGLGADSRVVEIASNDGYLLQYFVERGVPVLGIEPAANVAKAAEARGVPTEVLFFGDESARELAERGKRADLLIGNNVLAQVPDLRGFVRGLEILLEPQGVITLEFPHLLKLMNENQFDTIYHEHFSYFSLGTIEKFFASEGLTVFDVEELASHGGSLRVFARHTQDESKPVSERVARVLADEEAAGLGDLAAYTSFAEQVRESKRALLEFLIGVKREGKTVVGYGAPGKGNTLLNYCGIRTDFLDFTVDRNPYKHGRFTPGTRIPIHPPEKIREVKPDYLLILPWNLKDEIIEQESYIREWGGQFVVPIPKVQVIP